MSDVDETLVYLTQRLGFEQGMALAHRSQQLYLALAGRAPGAYFVLAGAWPFLPGEGYLPILMIQGRN